MIQIKSLATGTFLDLTPGQQATFTIENPMFSDDHLPLSVSTGIEFPVTPTNMAEFGFVDVMMLSPQSPKVRAVFILAGIEIFTGELKFNEFSDGALKYNFVGTIATGQINLSGKIYEIQSELYHDIDVDIFLGRAWNGAYEDFRLPMIVRKPNVSKIEYETPSAGAEVSIADKYANHLYSPHGEFVPAVKVGYLLNKILPNVSLPSEITPYLQVLAIIGTYKPERWWTYNRPTIPSFYDLSGSLATGPYCDNVRIAETLPDMTCADFVTNILKMFCATVFSGGIIKTNKSIINDTSFVDWTERVSKIYSVVAGEAGSYSLEYANENEGYTPHQEDDFGQSDISEDVVTCSSYSEMISGEFLVSDEYVNVQIETTKNIYSGKRVRARLGYFPPFGSEPIFRNEGDRDLATMDIIYQAGLDKVTIGETSDNSSSYDKSIGFHCVKCIPSYFSRPTGLDGRDEVLHFDPEPYPLRCMTPVIDFPAMGEERPSTVYIGLLYEHNMLDQGVYFTNQVPFVQQNFSTPTTPVPISIGGTNGLFEKFHRAFAEWITRKHDPIKADVFLEPADIVNLALWQKKMIHNRLFFIKSMELTIFDEADIAFANTEFIDATI